MSKQQAPLEAIKDIKRLMHNSSRFISLSGWSGVGAGLCALAGAAYTAIKIDCWKKGDCAFEHLEGTASIRLQSTLLQIALVTFAFAFLLAFLFTYIRSRKTGVPIWGLTARRVLVHVSVPMLAGGLLVWRLMDFGLFGLITPACLLFYGVALINASKYTYAEIRYLGYCQLLLGVMNLWLVGYGLYFWAMGFGILHIVYGIIMWYKYERQPQEGKV